MESERCLYLSHCNTSPTYKILQILIKKIQQVQKENWYTSNREMDVYNVKAIYHCLQLLDDNVISMGHYKAV